MPTPKKKRSTTRKRKGSVVVRSKAKIVKKGAKTAEKDTLKKAPFIMNDNGLNMRIKIKRKSR